MRRIFIAATWCLCMQACNKKYKVNDEQLPVSHEKVEVNSIITDTLNDTVKVNYPALQEQSNEVRDQAKLLKEAGDGLNKNK